MIVIHIFQVFLKARVINPETNTLSNVYHGLEYQNPWERTAYIYYAQPNHMQSTPHLPRTGWTLRYERKAVFKTQCMGWIHSFDSQSKRDIHFDSLESAVSYCRKSGVNFQIEYPNRREYRVKSYADNFRWKGEPVEDCE